MTALVDAGFHPPPVGLQLGSGWTSVIIAAQQQTAQHPCKQPPQHPFAGLTNSKSSACSCHPDSSCLAPTALLPHRVPDHPPSVPDLLSIWHSYFGTSRRAMPSSHGQPRTSLSALARRTSPIQRYECTPQSKSPALLTIARWKRSLLGTCSR